MADPLGQLWDRVRPEELERIHVLERAVAALMAGGLAESERRRAQDEAHKLAGALGALGYPAGSSDAGELERRFVRGPDPREAPELSRLVVSLRTTVESAGR
jgi:HPt (histidine-containing phosphotransfer) domain-containing protein